MYSLPTLGFAYDELEPYMDIKTVEIHYDKHHRGYLNKLIKALDGVTRVEDLSIEELLLSLDKVPEKLRQAVKNNGGGYVNHNLFWSNITPHSKQLSGDSLLLKRIKQDFGSLEKCIEKVSNASVTQFGSGWGWLAWSKKNEKLEAVSTSNQDTLYHYGKVPLLAVDVWEHAYYLKYQQQRAEYVKSFWNIVNWQEVEKRYLLVINK